MKYATQIAKSKKKFFTSPEEEANTYLPFKQLQILR